MSMHTIYVICFVAIVSFVIGLFIGSQSANLTNKIDIIRREEQHAERIASLIAIVNDFIMHHSRAVQEQYDKSMMVKDHLIRLMRRERKALLENIKEMEEVINADNMTDDDDDDDDDVSVGAVRTAVSTMTDHASRPSSHNSAQVALDLYEKIRDTRQLVEQNLSKEMDPQHVTLLLNCLSVDQRIEE